jgi:hypothetical protein
MTRIRAVEITGRNFVLVNFDRVGSKMMLPRSRIESGTVDSFMDYRNEPRSCDWSLAFYRIPAMGGLSLGIRLSGF